MRIKQQRLNETTCSQLDDYAEALNDIADALSLPTGASSSDIVNAVRSLTIGDSCAVDVIPSNPHPERDWHVIVIVGCKAFPLAYKGEACEDAKWMADQLKSALKKCGTRISSANVNVDTRA